MATMEVIQTATKLLADHRELLELRVDNLHNEIEELKRKHLPGIKEAAGDAANTKAALLDLLEESKPLFVKPKSIIISGIRVGLKKGSGKVEFDDEELVIIRLEKMFPQEDDRKVYIKTTKKVKKKPLEDLDGAVLKKLGITLEGTGDVVFIKAVDSDVDKIVNAMLKEAETADIEEAA